MKFSGRLIFFRAARAIEQNPDEILDVNETDYVIEIAFVDWYARTLRDGDNFHHVFERGVRGQRVNVRTRNHDFAHLNIAEIHRALNETFFDRLEDAALARLLHENAKLFGRADGRVALRYFYAERLNELARDAVEQQNGPSKCAQEPAERARDEQSDTFGVGKAQTFRHKLAKHDLQCRQQKKCEQKSEAMFDERSVTSGHPRKKGIQKIRQRKLAKIPEGKTCQRDSDLHAGNDRAHVCDEKLDDARAGVALLDELPDTRLPYGDKREFDGREERVDRNEHKNDEEMEGDHWSESNITGIESPSARVAAAT